MRRHIHLHSKNYTGQPIGDTMAKTESFPSSIRNKAKRLTLIIIIQCSFRNLVTATRQEKRQKGDLNCKEKKLKLLPFQCDTRA